ncbi:MAG TPA: sulfite exporter TauE/SafE family protein [Desulfotomaculum sp.]|nr:MAG: membrane protein [Peptococcaceae bacterium BRH_c8a]KJS76809.1 MAG: membrane protein [Desulfotomaculum sp. BICA1-6]HBX24159.1 sulfite exporter TauE/SafE family protein [Desulfotomaculum sp.]
MLDGLILKATMLVEMANSSQAAVAVTEATGTGLPWWAWPAMLLVTCFVLGIVAVMAGVGGGVLFVPIVGSFYPFHLDFVRGAGLIVALAGALAAGPGLLKANLANLRLALPVALIASTFSIVGAIVGLALPTDILQIALGVTITLIAILFIFSKNSEFPKVGEPDSVTKALKIGGSYYEPSAGKAVDWTVWRTPQGFFLFIAIGMVAGMFGLGAGWANVPVLNLLMGAPLKIAVGSSKFLLSITDTSAAWVYMNQGAVLPIIAVPSVVGIMIGSLVGVKLLAGAKPAFVRKLVIGMLLFAGIRSLLKGLGY